MFSLRHAAAAAAALVLAAPAVADAHAVEIATYNPKVAAAAKPARHNFDGFPTTGRLIRMTWARWGGNTATATGVVVLCQPSCTSTGQTTSHKVQIRATNAAFCRSGSIFSGHDLYRTLQYRRVHSTLWHAVPGYRSRVRANCA